METSPLDEKEKVLFRYLALVNDAPSAATQGDVDLVKAAGWTDEAIYDAVTVCAVFNFFNRWIDGTGVEDLPRGFYEGRLKSQGDVGYSF